MTMGQSEADKVKESELRSSGKRDPHDPSVNYFGPDQGPFRCGNCEYFLAPHSCKKVMGHISPDGCCNLFEKADEDE